LDLRVPDLVATGLADHTKDGTTHSADGDFSNNQLARKRAIWYLVVARAGI
jgi:hypothetical protein